MSFGSLFRVREESLEESSDECVAYPSESADDQTQDELREGFHLVSYG